MIIRYLLLFTALFFFPKVGYSADVAAERFHPPLGRYDYRVEWEGVKAGTARVTLGFKDGFFQMRAEARSRNVIDKLYKLRYRGEALIDAEDLRPIENLLESVEGRRQKTETTRFSKDGSIELDKSLRKGKKDYKPENKRFDFGKSLFDPFSAVLLARQFNWQLGQTEEFEIFTGSSHYLIELNCAVKRSLEVAGAVRRASVLVPTLENLSKPGGEPKLENTLIYLSDDERRELLRVYSKVFVGSVALQLTGFTPAQE